MEAAPVNIAHYRKRPVVVEAVRWYGGEEDGRAIVDWITDGGGDAAIAYLAGDPVSVSIVTLEGVMRATPGDWIIRGVQGEYYPCRSDIFDLTYELAP